MTVIALEDLRRLLWEAAGQEDAAALEELCRLYQDQIRQHFAEWRQIPADIRNQPAQAEGYVQTMVAIARVFQERLGDASLMEALVGKGKDNPVVQWQKELDEAQKAMEELRYHETAGRLADLLIDVHELKGSGPDTYRAITLGLMGECYFQSGEADKAVAPTEQALQICRRTGDMEGLLTYLGNLYEIHRYRGNGRRAADAAEELAEQLAQLGRTAEADPYVRQARLVRAGEPLNRVIVNIEGQRKELDELLVGMQGKVQFAIVRNRLTLAPAQSLTDQGEKLANQGRFEAALQLFGQAARADLYDPQCHYQAAFTLLYLQRYADARQEFQRVAELAPGWFQCGSGAWLAEQMRDGKVTPEVFQLLHVLEEGPLKPAQKSSLVSKALKQAPKLAVLHHIQGKCLTGEGQRTAAEAAFRRGLELADEPDIETRLLVDLGGVVEDKAEKRRLLEAAVELHGNLLATARARVLLAFA